MPWHGYLRGDGTCLLTQLVPIDPVVIKWLRGDPRLLVMDLDGGMQGTLELAKKFGVRRFVLHDPPQWEMYPMPELPGDACNKQ